MTQDQERRCRYIIHSHAILSSAGNALPLPGVGVAVDTITMTTMAMSLASVFGGDLKKSVARNMSINAIRRTVLKQPVKYLTKELSKLCPGLGQVVAPTVSGVMLETAGWSLAKDLDAKYSYAYQALPEKA